MDDIRIAVEIPEFSGIDLDDDTICTLEDVLTDVASKRGAQILAGFDAAHDDQNSPDEWEDRLQGQLTRANLDRLNRTDPAALQEWRNRLVDIAALAVAAVQSVDRLAAEQEVPAHG